MDPHEYEPLLEGMTELPEGSFDHPEAPSELREALLARTSRVIRGRRRRRRALLATTLVLAYLAGTATGSLFGGGGLEPAEVGGSVVRERQDPALPEDPRDLEERVMATDPGRRGELLRRAGDDYLSADRSDPASALYCYRRMFEEAPPSQVGPPGEEDSWLLLYLKLSRP